jgi:hypothetical protein
MNAFYRLFAQKLLEGGAFAIGADTIKAALVSTGYAVNLTTHEFYTSISANVLGVPVALAGKTFALGILDAADVTFAAVPSGDTALGVVLYKDTGVAGTSRLIAYIDTITGFPVATNNGDLQVVWDNGTYKIGALVPA